MFLQDDDPAMMGSWLSDAVHAVEHAVSSVVSAVTQSGNQGGPLSTTHGYTPSSSFDAPPGWYAMSPAAQDAYLHTMDAVEDDLQLIQAWKTACIAEGGYPTRDAQGELAERINGPDTAFPDFQPPYTYVRAPANVIAADHRASATLQPGVDAIIPRAPDALGSGGWPSLDWSKYLLWAAIGIGVVIVAPPLLSAVTGSSTARRRLRR